MKRLVLISTIGLACDSSDVRSYVDEGRVCVEPQDMADFEAGGALTLTYTADECISACPRLQEAACEAQVSGDRIIVQSEARWAPSDEVCIAVCAARSPDSRAVRLAGLHG